MRVKTNVSFELEISELTRYGYLYISVFNKQMSRCFDRRILIPPVQTFGDRTRHANYAELNQLNFHSIPVVRRKLHQFFFSRTSNCSTGSHLDASLNIIIINSLNQKAIVIYTAHLHKLHFLLNSY